jgi:hypothetical protein
VRDDVAFEAWVQDQAIERLTRPQMEEKLSEIDRLLARGWVPAGVKAEVVRHWLEEQRSAPDLSLRDWAIEHQPEEEMLWKNGYWDQVYLLRDSIRFMVLKGEDREGDPWDEPKVVSSHRSKSIILPVVQYVAPMRFDIWVRGNFHNWIVSVKAAKPVPDLFFDLFTRDEAVHEVYAEGFKREWVFGSYAIDQTEFTVDLPYINGALWTFMFLVSRSLA